MAKGFYLSLRMHVKTAALFADVFFDFLRTAMGRSGDARIRLITLAVPPVFSSRLRKAHAVLRPRARTLACLAVVSKPAAIKAARICASFTACRAFARRFLMSLRMGHPAHKFVLLLALTSGLCYSTFRASPLSGFFSCISVKNVTNAGRQLGICQHAFGSLAV